MIPINASAIPIQTHQCSGKPCFKEPVLTSQRLHIATKAQDLSYNIFCLLPKSTLTYVLL
jgi:hypothetical protein